MYLLQSTFFTTDYFSGNKMTFGLALFVSANSFDST